jgi:hypothetical protein
LSRQPDQPANEGPESGLREGFGRRLSRQPDQPADEGPESGLREGFGRPLSRQPDQPANEGPERGPGAVRVCPDARPDACRGPERPDDDGRGSRGGRRSR